MYKQLIVSGLIVLGCLGCQHLGAKAKPEGLPNVIVLITDDQGWADIGYNNPQHVYTPHLDKLAETGVRFANHYVMPQCTPTRVALFTGRYPGRFGRTPLQATNAKCFDVGTPTLARMFKARGYETYQCGKWHMGSDLENGPNHHGFDHSYGSLAGAIGMYDHRYRSGPYELAWHRDLKTIPGNENGRHATDLVADEAVRVIREKREKPFFMYLAFNAPHTPLDERGPFVDTPTQLDPKNPNRWLHEDQIKWFNDPEGKIQSEPDPEKRLFLAVVYHLDDAIGRVIQALDESGQRERTLILFSSDNGPQVNWNGNAYPNDLHLTNFNQPIPMRGSKCDVWEGGIHVASAANWPGHITPGVIAEPTHIVDWFPTLAGIIGYHPAKPIAWDGVDLSGLILNHQPLPDRDMYWIWNPSINRRALHYGDWKIVRYGTGEPKKALDWQLFNLRNDPQETTDISKENGDKLNELYLRYKTQRQKDLE